MSCIASYHVFLGKRPVSHVSIQPDFGCWSNFERPWALVFAVVYFLYSLRAVTRGLQSAHAASVASSPGFPHVGTRLQCQWAPVFAVVYFLYSLRAATRGLQGADAASVRLLHPSLRGDGTMEDWGVLLLGLRLRSLCLLQRLPRQHLWLLQLHAAIEQDL